ncbi:hypothetical protein DMH04_55795 [Kibdelosporangium aridum]|uniref:Uncharacterized protein n=1 Tax=Kibdelosporangium aridum TaxID=2030 RepID=A0A428XVP5_KIBAR|nr:hypothetical protein [Kibdelosporangium aridum]RSM59413.1 hypothetical protein DMH04_55795 [Kibdelosporangium aridum]
MRTTASLIVTMFFGHTEAPPATLATPAGRWCSRCRVGVLLVGSFHGDFGEAGRALDSSILDRDDVHGRSARYRMLQTIREYGQDKLREAGEDAVLRRRHRDWYQRCWTAPAPWGSATSTGTGWPALAANSPTCGRRWSSA